MRELEGKEKKEMEYVAADIIVDDFFEEVATLAIAYVNETCHYSSGGAYATLEEKVREFEAATKVRNAIGRELEYYNEIP